MFLHIQQTTTTTTRIAEFEWFEGKDWMDHVGIVFSVNVRETTKMEKE